MSRLIQDSTVTVVLIGDETGGRAWIDWEIYHSLRERQGTLARPGVTRNGLLGIRLPYAFSHWVPDRLQKNVPSMGVIIDWPQGPIALTLEIEMAFSSRNGTPDLSDAVRQRNSSRLPGPWAY